MVLHWVLAHECDRLRRNYQEHQAAGLMTLNELSERLGELEDTRSLALEEMEALVSTRSACKD